MKKKTKMITVDATAKSKTQAKVPTTPPKATNPPTNPLSTSTPKPKVAAAKPSATSGTSASQPNPPQSSQNPVGGEEDTNPSPNKPRAGRSSGSDDFLNQLSASTKKPAGGTSIAPKKKVCFTFLYPSF